MICEICKRFCKDNRSLGVHVKAVHHMTAKEYYIKHIGPQKYCLTCGKPTNFVSLTQGFRDHCCNKCAQLDPIVAKAREEGCLAHFGYTNANKDPEKHNRIINTRVKHINKLANQNNLTAIPHSDSYMLSRICAALNIEIIKIGQKCFVHNEDYSKLIELFNNWKNGQSLLELQVIDCIKSIYKGQIIYNDKTIISPKELDVYLPERELAFEINGNYRHSKEFKDKFYHINKTNLCKDKNIKLVHIFEFEWQENKDKVKQCIYNAINNIVKTDNYLTLDLSKESLLSYPDYQILEIQEPILMNNIYNCGYAKITNNIL